MHSSTTFELAPTLTPKTFQYVCAPTMTCRCPVAMFCNFQTCYQLQRMRRHVDMLNVHFASPPVPQVSTTISITYINCEWPFLSLHSHNLIISSTVSPFIRNAVIKEPICTSVALPSIISLHYGLTFL